MSAEMMRTRLLHGLMATDSQTCYIRSMPEGNAHRPESEHHENLLDAAKLQEIEGNPLTAVEIAMFEMFDREGWTPERQRAHILAQIRPIAAE
jgi:hypothetical protein